MNLERGRAVADAVLYEGYLLYPYRASSSKNQSRWQFGVLGPPGAAEAGLGEAASMRMQAVITSPAPNASATVHLRFLHLQRRQVHDIDGAEVAELDVAGTRWTSWDEAVECELDLRLARADLDARASVPVHVDGTEETDPLPGSDGAPAGRVVRRTWPLDAQLEATLRPGGRYRTMELRVRNTCAEPVTGKDEAARRSLIGAHVLVEAHGFGFVSMVDPAPEAAALVAGCTQDRCWPVLAGDPGDTDLLLGSPIILYDYPEIAAQSAGTLYDGTEIDEILTLRVMTMTEQEKAEARATDPRAREIIDRCEAMSPEALQQMHGVLRDPQPPSFETGGAPWWSPEEDERVQPGLDAVVIDGVRVARDSLVTVHPSRRADAQDLFFADQVARVTAVISDVDGGTHVALVLLDDPAAEINDLSGRYWYFSPDEVTPLSPQETQQAHAQREGVRP